MNEYPSVVVVGLCQTLHEKCVTKINCNVLQMSKDVGLDEILKNGYFNSQDIERFNSSKF